MNVFAKAGVGDWCEFGQFGPLGGPKPHARLTK
jgi:hypothetical protein